MEQSKQKIVAYSFPESLVAKQSSQGYSPGEETLAFAVLLIASFSRGTREWFLKFLKRTKARRKQMFLHQGISLVRSVPWAKPGKIPGLFWQWDIRSGEYCILFQSCASFLLILLIAEILGDPHITNGPFTKDSQFPSTWQETKTVRSQFSMDKI